VLSERQPDANRRSFTQTKVTEATAIDGDWGAYAFVWECSWYLWPEKITGQGVGMRERLAAVPARQSDQCGHAAGGCERNVVRMVSGQVFGSLAIRIQPFRHKKIFSN
jgi:hypothetical protein